MRLRTIAVGLALAGCGRIGYEPTSTDGGDVDVAVDAGPIGTFMACDAPVLLIDLGDTGAGGASSFYLDVAATTTGFVAGWQAGSTQTHTSGLAISSDASGPYLHTIQSDSMLTVKEGPMALAAIGDQVLLGVDDVNADALKVFPLAETGYDRGGEVRIDGYRARGHDWVTADPARGRFVVTAAASTGGETVAFTRDLDGNAATGPAPLFPVDTESVAARPFGGGFATITGNSSNCDVVLTDSALVAQDLSRQAISMTCHNASLALSPDATSMVAAWNCDNDAVWTTGGPPTGALPPYHAVYGDGTNSASNPRLGTTSAGVWFAFQVTGDRLGRALLGPDAEPLPGGDAAIVYTSTGFRAYDLATHGDDAFLFWIEVNASITQLWSMRLCPP
ncbi:MAG: hypothetical protein IPL61_32585 [Myxococcales bacterium]|nr:hypothetical protein [Myxococcales bacterium]